MRDINTFEYISEDKERNKLKKFTISSDSMDNNNNEFLKIMIFL